MTDYTKLVEALRRCAEPGTIIDECDTYDDCPYSIDGYCGDCMNNLVKDAADAIEALQAQLPKHGEWIEENRRPRSSQFVCSECHRTAYDPQPTRDKAWRKRCRYAYCPNCGAKMEVQDASRMV